ncbi:PREDICTED: uncharacterized protein LOC109305609 isoform X2 [Crocodylus porosus]|uniref:uncharacterized protein LOC109305609 isoform X2 n=1 Tax=Crocodylus porosus TaxID=8502 RepID=UPI00093BB7D3|nr:PREDICTED: uncharacterized protein LOC109305609 isoform X2 [Crocodylus porosus]
MDDLGERLHRSGLRFAAALNGIVTKYSFPFEDDVLVSMQTLSCNTPDGPKSWEDISQNYLKRRRKSLKKTTHYQATTETEQSIAGVEDEEMKIHQEVSGESFIQSSEDSQVEDTDTENKADLVSIRRSFENVNLEENNRLLADLSEMEMGDKFRVRVDVIVQGDDRNIPKWITVAPREKPESIHLLSPLQGLMEKSRFVFDTVAPRCQPLTKKNETGYDSFYEEYQSADEECSWSNVTLADLYPSMVENLSKLINRQTQRKIADYIIRNYRRRGWHPKKPRLNVTMVKTKRFRPAKVKCSLQNTHDDGNDQEKQKLLPGNKVNENNYDTCLTRDESDVLSCLPFNTEAMEIDCIIDCSGSFASNYTERTDQNILKSTGFPNAVVRTDETLLIESPSRAAVSLNHSQSSPTEKLPEISSQKYPFVTCTGGLGSVSLCLMKDGENSKIDGVTFDSTSERNSPTCNFNVDADTFLSLNNYSLARTSDVFHRQPEIKPIKEGVLLQRSHSFSSLPMNRSPSKAQQKYETAFEKVYQKLCSKELQKPLIFPKTPSSLRRFEERESLFKINFSDSETCHKQYDHAFDKIYQKLHTEGLPKLPTFLRASNLRKYECIQMSETVNALINSPIRTLPSLARIKRVADIHKEDLLFSPLKRLKNVPESYCPKGASPKSSHKKHVNPQATGMDLSNTNDGIVASLSRSPNNQNYDSENFNVGFPASPNRTFLVHPSTFLQESRIADIYATIPRMLQNHGSTRNAEKRQQRQVTFSEQLKRYSENSATMMSERGLLTSF